MNLKKFFFILCCIISTFLFVSGIAILVYITDASDNGSSSVFGEIIQSFKPERDPVNVLFMVSDSGENPIRTDTMMLVNFNPVSAQLNILSIPRDTRICVNGSSSKKINSFYASGVASYAVKTISNLLNTNIKYYVYFDISTIREIVDLLGGVEFNIPVDMNYDDPTQDLHIHLKKGFQRLNGKKAEQFLRFRHPNKGGYTKEMLQYYDGSDLKRVDAQLQFVKELIRQKSNVYYLTRFNSILSIIFDSIKTNITINETMKLSNSIGKLDSNEINMFKISGYDNTINGVSYFIYNGQITDITSRESTHTKNIIEQYFECKDSFKNTLD